VEHWELSTPPMDVVKAELFENYDIIKEDLRIYLNSFMAVKK